MHNDRGDPDLDIPLVQRIVKHEYTGRQLLAIDVIVVVVVLVFSVFIGPHVPARFSGATWRAVAGVGDAVAGVTVLFRRRFKWATLTVLLPMTLVDLALRGQGPIFIYLVMAVYSVVAASPRRSGLWVVSVVAGSTMIGAIIGGGNQEVSSITGVVAIVLLGWMAGENTRASHVYASHQAEREAERATEREADRAEQIQRAVADERIQIARELHDIVAHAMSIIAVRSGVARMVIDTQPEEAREALSIIETVTRLSLQEMRLLVDVLRDADGYQAGLSPAPGLKDVDRLVTDSQVTGVSVNVAIAGLPRALSPAADLSAYRIVQEALTNVVRHVGPTHAEVQITYGLDEVGIEVTDEGPSTGIRRDPPVRGRERAGHGLIGMKERTALFGGKLQAGPCGHGFRVKASLRTDG